MSTVKKLTLRVLTENDASAFREIRLEALKAHPEAFLGSYEIESKESSDFFVNYINTDKIVGCFKDDKLLGIAGYYIVTPDGKRSHSAKLWGFYIRPEYRGRGFASRLLAVILSEAKKRAEKVLLKVHKKNRSAIQLYKKLGFETYGLERQSLKIGDRYYDDLLMVKFF